MISTFDLTKLNSLLKDFYNITRIRISVMDENLQELASYPKQHSELCRLIRQNPAARAACLRCDREGCRAAAANRSLHTYQCHAGLTESISPLFMSNILIGYLLFGQVLSSPTRKEGWQMVERCCRPYGLDAKALEAACRKQPLRSVDFIASASHILQAVASYLCLERMAVLKYQELPVQIDQYILTHCTENLIAEDICAHFGIGRTQLYEIARQNYGMGIAKYIRHLRMEKAKELLSLQPPLPLSEIAARCGYTGYNYFITAFKNEVGLPPRKYLNQTQQHFSEPGGKQT